jgi:hypothetical protein
MMLSSSADAQLRAAYATLLIDRDPVDRANCPDPDAIVAIVERRAGESARLETLDHVMACAKCRRDLDLVRTASAAAQASGSHRSVTRFPTNQLLALAATIIVVVGLGIYFRASTRSDAPVMRGNTELALHAASRGANGAIVSWHAAAGARRYELSIIDGSGRQLLNRSLLDTSLVVADSLLRDLRGVVVSVSAIREDGTTVGPVSAQLSTLIK